MSKDEELLPQEPEDEDLEQEPSSEKKPVPISEPVPQPRVGRPKRRE